MRRSCNIYNSNNCTCDNTKVDPPLPHSPICWGCNDWDARASVYCYECAKSLCIRCDNRLHGSSVGGGLDGLLRPMCSHRVEVIVDGGGINILTPALELFCLTAGMWSLGPLMSAAGRALNVGYFFDSVCPVVTGIRRLVFKIDHALYPIVKGPLANLCDSEDAFVKIFADIWVRGVLTSTDSYALILMKAPDAIGAFILVMTLIPFVSVPYASLATTLRLFELYVLPNNSESLRVAAICLRCINTLAWFPWYVAAWFCRATVLGLIIDDKTSEAYNIKRQPIPPKTGRRLRPTPSYGIKDISIIGSISRITRIFTYYRKRVRRTLTSSILTLVFLAIVIRIGLLHSTRCHRGIFMMNNNSHNNKNDDGTNEVCTEEENNNKNSDHKDEQCYSMHQLSLYIIQTVGVEVPTLDDLGQEDVTILESLEKSTRNGFLDDALKRLSKDMYYAISNSALYIKFLLFLLLIFVFFAGMIRRIVYWLDFYQRQNKICTKNVSTNMMK